MKATDVPQRLGLPDPEQMTTARDMVTLALRLQDDFPALPAVRHAHLHLRRRDLPQPQHAALPLRGHRRHQDRLHRASGFNLVASVRRGKKHVFVAVFRRQDRRPAQRSRARQTGRSLAKASEHKTRQPAPLVTAKAKGAPVGGQAKGATVAVVPPPQPAKRASAADGLEIARVRPVRAGVPEAKASPKAEAPPPTAADDDETAPPPKGAFHVQIGAFQTKAEAERQLASVRERAGTVLGAYAAHMSRVKRGDKTFFRARYVGFDAQAAAAGVCGELKQMEIDCLVMKAE